MKTNIDSETNNKIFRGKELKQMISFYLLQQECITPYKRRNAVYTTKQLDANKFIFSICKHNRNVIFKTNLLHCIKLCYENQTL